MANKEHHYNTIVTWTGNLGKGTTDYKSYERDHIITVPGKPEIPGTSEVSMMGNKVRYNPEELLLASLSACHMLWFLFLCSKNNVVVTEYVDSAAGTMINTPDGGGYFTEAVLKPQITISGILNEELMEQLHVEANKLCFIANSCNFPVKHEAVYL
jgi:organic hydroperoxide reductase OsmC/OhrA